MAVKLFGTDGIRGVANKELTPEVAYRLGQAVVKFLAGKKRARFLVGRDTRISGTMLESALVAGITSAGASAYVCGVIPTPAVALLVRELEMDGGIVISASHNPPEFNGLKVFSREGFKLPDDLEEDIEEFLHSEEPAPAPMGRDIGTVSSLPDALRRYIDAGVSFIEPGLFSNLRVAVDAGHGAAGQSTPHAFERLGASVTAMNTNFNGNDINVGCGSTNMKKLSNLMKSGNYDLGIAHDGDADRMLAVDELGNEIDGDQIMAICAVYLKSQGRLKNDTVVSTVMCNLGFEVAMKEQGIQVVRAQVGDRYVLEQMQAMDATLGGEQSGHIIFLEHNSTGDGLVTALSLAEVIVRSGKPLSELAGVMTEYPQVLLNVPVADKTHLTASARITEAVKTAEVELGDTGRVLVRASGTEPLVRVMVEAKDIQVARRVADELGALVARELG
ncbi:MAG: phosphoglucosamine mutase [Coriobacteriia bacterium]|nr:phosphoglucosamine mutase [Coriobacteriia bacterium]